MRPVFYVMYLTNDQNVSKKIDEFHQKYSSYLTAEPTNTDQAEFDFMHGPVTRFHENPFAKFGVYPLTPTCSNQHGDRNWHSAQSSTQVALCPTSPRWQRGLRCFRRKSQEVAKGRKEWIYYRAQRNECSVCHFHPSGSLTCTGSCAQHVIRQLVASSNEN